MNDVQRKIRSYQYYKEIKDKLEKNGECYVQYLDFDAKKHKVLQINSICQGGRNGGERCSGCIKKDIVTYQGPNLCLSGIYNIKIT